MRTLDCVTFRTTRKLPLYCTTLTARSIRLRCSRRNLVPILRLLTGRGAHRARLKVKFQITVGWLANRKVSRNASAVSDAPHMELQVDFWRRAGRVRFSCLKEGAGDAPIKGTRSRYLHASLPLPFYSMQTNWDARWHLPRDINGGIRPVRRGPDRRPARFLFRRSRSLPREVHQALQFNPVALEQAGKVAIS